MRAVGRTDITKLIAAILRMRLKIHATYVQRDTTARSRKVYTSSAIVPDWQHCTRKERFYGHLISPATIKRNQIFV